MEKEWLGEVAWAVIFGLTAVSSAVLLMSDGSVENVRAWIEAVGGLAAAIFVIPTIILLRRQTFIDEEQGRLAKLPALERKKADLRTEASLSRVVTARLDKAGSTHDLLYVIYTENDFSVAESRFMNEFANIPIQMSPIIDEIEHFNNDNPSSMFARQRVVATAALEEGIDRVRQLRTKYVKQFVNANLNRQSLEEYVREIGAIVYEVRTKGDFIGWQQKVADELAATQRRIDAIDMGH